MFFSVPVATLTASHFFHGGCLWCFPTAWPGFALHVNELCIMTSMFVVSLPVETVCVFMCVSCVVRALSFFMLSTGNTQTSHPIARSPSRLPPHKGTDTAMIFVHYMLHDQLLFDSFVSWFNETVIKSKQVIALLTNRPMLTVVFSLVCSARPVGPFWNVSSDVGEEGTLISWQYWGPEKNIYVEYIVNNSKQSNTLWFVSSMHEWQETPTSLLAGTGE